MKFLLFLLGIVFFFIFYLFSLISGIDWFFISNLFWIANIYIAASICIITFLFLSQISFNNWKEDDRYQEDFKKQYIPSIQEMRSFIADIFSYYIYYIACGLFYWALYIILKSFYSEANLPLLFIVLNSVVIALYFIEHKFKVFQDFIRVNLVLISLYYILIHSKYLLWFWYEFSLIDFINIVWVFFLFWILLYSKRSWKYFQILSHYFIAFSFLEVATLYQISFSGEILSLWIIASVLWWWFLVFTSIIKNFTHFSKGIIRFWGVIFLSIFTIVSLFHIWNEDGYSLILIPLLCISSYLFYKFHVSFQNYEALTMWAFWFIWALYGLYSILLGESFEKGYLFIFCFFLSAGILFFEWIYKKYPLYDIYFFHSLSLLVNLLWVFYFFYFRDFSILSLWFLLLGESIYLFFSYYTISNAKRLW